MRIAPSQFPQPGVDRLAHLIVSNRRWVVLAMLLALHAALLSAPGEIFQRLYPDVALPSRQTLPYLGELSKSS